MERKPCVHFAKFLVNIDGWVMPFDVGNPCLVNDIVFALRSFILINQLFIFRCWLDASRANNNRFIYC